MGDRHDESRGVPANERLRQLRAEIDRLDAEILERLNERGRLALEIGSLKHGDEQPIYAPHRERAVLARLRELNRGGVYPDEAIEAIFGEIISASRALEKPLHIAYLGPEATFTHIAARRKFGVSVVYVPQPTQQEVFREVEGCRCHYGVVPVENSTMGVVIDTLDLFSETSLRICGEVLLPITHNLLSKVPLDKVERIYSHQQAFAQCRGWLQEHLPGAERIALSSTSEAARRAAAEPNTAAIASQLAAETYGLDILAEHIEDRVDNITRFLVVGHHAAEPTGNDKTSIRFMVRHEVGALVRVLERFRDHGINLSSIESRPSRIRSWEYVFYIDVAGHADVAPLAEALREVERECQSLRVLGSYPCG